MPTVNNNLNSFIRRVVYQLKKEYGGCITIYKLGQATTNRKTGVKTETHTSYEINRSIVLPSKVLPEILKTISMISANKNFVMGGTYDTGTRLFIVDRKDVTVISELTTYDWIIYNDKRYDITKIDEFEQNTAWMITAKVQEGHVPAQDKRARGENFHGFEQTVSVSIV